MVAEDRKEVEKKEDGNAVKGIDEKGHDRAGCSRRGYYVKPNSKNLYAFARATAGAVLSHRPTTMTRTLPFKSHVSYAQRKLDRTEVLNSMS